MRVQGIPTLAGPKLALPDAFDRLHDLAFNLWWAWDGEAQELWERIDPRRWHESPFPISLLVGVDASNWEALATNESFIDQYHSVTSRFDEYINSEDTWYDRHTPRPPLEGPVAYLCTEYGLHHKLPFYSGGLGVLAGDHLKTASDMGIPMVAVGMLYRRGYFRQAVDPAGDQEHYYPQVDLARRPMRLVADRTGAALKVKLDFPGRQVSVAVWTLQVGRAALLFLDTDLPENDPSDRPITHLLYVRGREMRLAQELVLGVGAVKALNALDITPSVWHVNEGHSAFSIFERMQQRMSDGETFDSALAAIRRKTLFTLHTPVPAGNEKFEPPQVQRYAQYLFPSITSEQVAEMGSAHDGGHHMFDMGAFAIRASSYVNGVSERHGAVATADWGGLVGTNVDGLTNGVHVPTWVGRPTARLFAEAIGPDWQEHLTHPESWEALLGLPDEKVWSSHQAQKKLLSRSLRQRLRNQLGRHGAGPDELRSAVDLIDPERLTIGFARRFATYKRATLLFSDLPRLQAILTNPDRPAQIFFAGKAHPADEGGQDLIRRVVEVSKWPEFRGHILFIEDYDMELAKLLVTGVDVWLNNPVPPKEASGTSGMKAALNGALNLSVPDGWWAEGARPGSNGWSFGPEDEHPGMDYEDAGSLYHLLENEVVPLFYDRDADGVPKGWVEMMKASMATVTQPFSSHRMLAEYATRAYFPLGGLR